MGDVLAQRKPDLTADRSVTAVGEFRDRVGELGLDPGTDADEALVLSVRHVPYVLRLETRGTLDLDGTYWVGW